MRTRSAVYVLAFTLMGYEGSCLPDGCGGGGGNLQAFDVAEPIPEQHIAAGAPGSMLGGLFAPMRLSVSLQAETASHGTGPAKLAFVTALSLRLVPSKNRPGNHFDFLREVHLFVEAAGQAKKEIAKLAPVAAGQTTLRLDVDADVDLLPYLDAGATLSATVTGTQPSEAVYFDGQVVIEVRI